MCEKDVCATAAPQLLLLCAAAAAAALSLLLSCLLLVFFFPSLSHDESRPREDADRFSATGLSKRVEGRVSWSRAQRV